MLKTREGYIPVFIRFGDQPLAEIDPDLAEAFGEAHEVSARNIKSVRYIFVSTTRIWVKATFTF